MAPEREVIIQFCLNQDTYNTLNHNKLDEILKGLYRPTSYEFHKYIREANPEPDIARAIWSAIEEIIATSSKVYSEETRCLEYIKKKWKSRL